MTTVVLIHGASDAWYWHLLAPLLEARGHEVIVPELPSADDAAGLPEYVQSVLDVIGERGADDGRRLAIVGQSLGAFTAVMVAERMPTSMIVLIAPMIPLPGETAGAWWENTGQEEARRAADVAAGRDPDAEFDPVAVFLHDLPTDTLERALARGERPQSGTPFGSAWEGAAWPDAPTVVIAGRNDRFFPLEFVQRMSRDRLGVEPAVIDSGHLPALSRPEELAALLDGYFDGL